MTEMISQFWTYFKRDIANNQHSISQICQVFLPIPLPQAATLEQFETIGVE